MSEIMIPGTGWDTESVVTGFIKFFGLESLQCGLEHINQFEFDDVYPFTNIFWGPSPAAYGCNIIGFAGSYKQIEEDWEEWLWKFSQLLSGLDAGEAQVNLSCILGEYRWKLEPRRVFERVNQLPHNLLSEQTWGITDNLRNRFHSRSQLAKPFRFLNRGAVGQWTKFVERWKKPDRPAR